MKKELYIRFTNNIMNDIKKGTSVDTATDRIIDGLCAFPGKNSIEATIEKAHRIGKYCADNGDMFVIVMAYQNINEKSGSLGVVIRTDDIEIITKGFIK